MKKYICILFISSLIFSCDPFIRLKINDTDTFTYNFECGEMLLDANIGLGKICINLKSDLHNQIIIRKNNLIIKLNNRKLDAIFYDAYDRKISADDFTLNGKSSFAIYVDSPESFNHGDLLSVNAENFIICNGKALVIPLLTVETEILVREDE
jgi:hypothetical protein